jgi:hypothetical protein
MKDQDGGSGTSRNNYSCGRHHPALQIIFLHTSCGRGGGEVGIEQLADLNKWKYWWPWGREICTNEETHREMANYDIYYINLCG